LDERGGYLRRLRQLRLYTLVHPAAGKGMSLSKAGPMESQDVHECDESNDESFELCWKRGVERVNESSS
jgi:hypothetical protein